MRFLSRNVTIVVIILILVLLAGYLVWIRSRFTPPTAPQMETVVSSPSPMVSLSPSPTASGSATPSATPKQKSATGGAVVK